MFKVLKLLEKTKTAVGIIAVYSCSFLFAASSMDTNMNLLTGDSSFECGFNGWFGKRDTTSPAADGDASLCIAPGDVMKFYYPGKRDNKIYKNTIPLRTECLLSFYARASENNHQFTIKVVTSRHYKAIAIKTFNLSKQWNRYSLVIPPQEPVRDLHMKGGADKYSFRVWWDNSGTAKVWLDAVQITEGNKLRPYVQHDRITCGISNTDSPWNILLDNEKNVVLQCQARNNQPREQKVKISFYTENFQGAKEPQSSRELNMIPGKTYTWTFPAIENMKPGFYKSVFEVREPDGEKISSASRSFVIVKPPVNIAIDQSLMGIVPTGYCLYPSALTALEKMGVKWLRIMRPRYGTHDWWHNTLDYNKFGIDLSLSVYNPPLDNNRKDKSQKELHTIYTDMLKVMDFSKIKYVEIENEPDGGLMRGFGFTDREAIKFYLKELKNGSKALKQMNPAVSILACNGTSHLWSYEDALKYASGSFDVLTYHPYATRRSIDKTNSDTGPESAGVKEMGDNIKKLIQKYKTDKKVWISEIGWQLEDSMDVASEQAKRRARYLARTYLLGKAAGVEKIIYFISCYLVEFGGYEWGLWRPDQQPLPDVAVYAATAQILEGAKYNGPIYEKQDLKAYAYKSRDKENFFAIWNTEQCDEKIVLKFPADKINKVLNIMGNEVLFSPNGNGLAILNISTSPLYIYYKNMSLPELSKLVASGNNLPSLKLKVHCEHSHIVICNLKNVSSHEEIATVSVSSPGITFTRDSLQVKLAPNEQKRINFIVKAPEAAKLSSKTITVTAETPLRKIREVFDYQTEPVNFKHVDITKPFDEAVKGLKLIEISDISSVISSTPWLLWKGKDDLSIVAATAWDDEYFYFLAKVKDDVHYQNQQPESLWKEDSLQLAFDIHASGDKNIHAYDGDDAAIDLAVLAGNKTSAYSRKKIQHADPIKGLKFIGEHKDGYTIYKCAIPLWPGLYMKPPQYNRRCFGFNFIINDNDGNGRKYFMGLTPGIGEEKYPWIYKKFVLVGKPKK